MCRRHATEEHGKLPCPITFDEKRPGDCISLAEKSSLDTSALGVRS